MQADGVPRHRFTSDQSDAAVKRIFDVKTVRQMQMPEDAGLLAHPIRPEEHVKMDNFYTRTVQGRRGKIHTYPYGQTASQPAAEESNEFGLEVRLTCLALHTTHLLYFLTHLLLPPPCFPSTYFYLLSPPPQVIRLYETLLGRAGSGVAWISTSSASTGRP